MKVECIDIPVVNFQPRQLTLKFESHEEVEAFYAIFNTIPVCEMLEKHTGIKTIATEIRTCLEYNNDINIRNNAWDMLENLMRDRFEIRRR